MLIETKKDKGRAGISMAIAYFGSNGYTISIPLNDTQKYDLIVEKDGIFQSVSCKFGGAKTPNEDAYSCELRTIGAKGTYHGTVKESGADLLFCLRPDKIMYVIPISILPNSNTIRLITKPSKFSPKSSFDTSKYIVDL